MPNFPQLEWINVDGKLVPSTKPQHYKKGSITETELTGHDNPLPVEDDAVKKAVKDLELALNELDIPDADYTTILNKLDEINASVVDNKIDFPENQKVSDDLVLAKLNELEAEIKEIKTRMDGTFNTQLIGSNVEDGLPVKS